MIITKPRGSLRAHAARVIGALRRSAPCPAAEYEQLVLNARDAALEADDKLLEAEALLHLGRTFVPSTNPQRSWLLLQHARAIFETNGLETKALSCRLGLAQLLFDMGEEVNAIAVTQRVLEKMALSAEDRGFANILIALCHSHLGELDPALARLSSVAMPLARLCPNSPLLAQVKWAQGLTYIRLYMYRRHVELFRGWPGMPEIKASLPSPEDVYALFDDAQSLIPNSRHWPYLDIGKLLAQGLMAPSPAAVEALSSISRRNLQVDPPLSARALFCQGLVQRRLGKPLDALSTFGAALQCSKPLDSWSITRDVTLNISRIHEELGNHGEALETYKIYSDLRLRGLINSSDLESVYFGPLEAVKPHEQHHQLRSLDPIFVKRAISYILENIEKRIAIDEVVRHSGVSRRTLETAFREAKSSSIGKFIKTHKIQRASADLSYTQISINEVARKYGFLSAEVFSRDFRSFFGCSPSRWRSLQ